LQWSGILVTLLVAREQTVRLWLQMLVLVCLESVADEVKVRLCESRGIPVRRVRLHHRGNKWFVLTLVLIGTATAVGSVCAIRADCFFFGPQ
jgi:hypothetical protein